MKMYFFNLLKSVSKPSDELEVKDYIHNSKSIVFNSKEEMYLSENEPEYKRNPFDNIGVPMGAAFSPLFATMVLEMVIMKLKKKFPSPILDILIYADDGLFYGCATKYVMDIIREFEKQLKKYGCELKPKGCRMLMENGKWKESIKFVGLRFSPLENKFCSETRSGKTLNLALSLTKVWFNLEKVIIPKHWLIYPLYINLCETIETKVEKYLVNYLETSNYHQLFKFDLQRPVIIPSEKLGIKESNSTRQGNYFHSEYWKKYHRRASVPSALWEKVFKGWDKLQENLGFKIDTENLKENEWLWSPYDFSKYKELLREKFDIKELKDNKGWNLNLLTIMTSSVTWSNTVYTKWFGMLLARLYIGNWGEEVSQNFLTKGEVGSLLNSLFSYKHKWKTHDTENYLVSLDPSLNHLQALENFRLTPFNATSLCITYLMSSGSVLKKVRKSKLLTNSRRFQWYLKNYLRCNIKAIYQETLGLSGQVVPISKHKGRKKYKLEWFDVWLGEQEGYCSNRVPKKYEPPMNRFEKAVMLNYRKRYWLLNRRFSPKNYYKNIDVYSVRIPKSWLTKKRQSNIQFFKYRSENKENDSTW